MIERAGVAHELRRYDLPMEDFSAQAVADLIEMPAAHVFKTLLTHGDRSGPLFAVVPGDAELDLKALAKATNNRKTSLATVSEVEPLTGYRRGAVTALGARKRLPVVLDAHALGVNTMGVSAGSKGLQVLLAPGDYVAMTDAIVADIACVSSHGQSQP